jgi:hypothetical protein
MAVGDVISAIQSVATGAYWDFQPSAGVEVQIVGVRLATSIHLYDGTTRTHTLGDRIGYDMGGVAVPCVRELLITNARYLSIYNGEGVTLNLAYWGIQIK